MASQKLSPSFYQPFTLHLYSRMLMSSEMIFLAAQFNHFPSWTLLPEYHDLCLSHLESSSMKKEFLIFAQKKIQMKNIPMAITILKKCEKFQCSEIFRLLARLLFVSDPNAAYNYAEKALSLGDSAALNIKNELLDSGKVESSDQVSSSKLLLISQLLCKLDPCFAYNAESLIAGKRQDFITFITGKLFY